MQTERVVFRLDGIRPWRSRTHRSTFKLSYISATHSLHPPLQPPTASMTYSSITKSSLRPEPPAAGLGYSSSSAPISSARSCFLFTGAIQERTSSVVAWRETASLALPLARRRRSSGTRPTWGGGGGGGGIIGRAV
jgi:hypothetical protein